LSSRDSVAASSRACLVQPVKGVVLIKDRRICLRSCSSFGGSIIHSPFKSRTIVAGIETHFGNKMQAGQIRHLHRV